MGLRVIDLIEYIGSGAHTEPRKSRLTVTLVRMVRQRAEAAADRTTADADIFALSGALCKSYGAYESMTALSPFEDIKNRINE